MWTLENNIKDIIKKANGYLEADDDDAFLKVQDEVVEMIEDMMVKEEEILYPTAMDLLSDEDFIEMRKGDDEIGYCLINHHFLMEMKRVKRWRILLIMNCLRI